MIFARPEAPRIQERLKKLLCIPVSFETRGSQGIVYQVKKNPRYITTEA